jgi:DNA-binding GntR family transcriptional regulator
MPGTRIVETELCDQLRVSRTPLREALNRLVYEGLVTPVPYRGYAVAPLTVEGIRELLEVRRINEAAAAVLGAARFTDDEIARIEMLAEVNYTIGDRESYTRYLRTNSAFHLAIAQGLRDRDGARVHALIVEHIDHAETSILGALQATEHWKESHVVAPPPWPPTR